MSLLTQAMVVEKYGLRLDTSQLAQLLGITRGAVLNQISAGTLGIPTYKDGNARYADYRDVAEYFDRCRKLAA